MKTMEDGGFRGRTRWTGAAWVVLALSALSPVARAQVLSLDMRPVHGAYIVGEPVMARVTVSNLGTQPIVIGDHEVFRNNRLEFQIYTEPDASLPLLRKGRIIEELDLDRDESTTVEVDLARWYALLPEGRYFASAVLFLNDRRYVSEQRVFDVVPGIELASLAAALPGGPLSERRFSFVYWVRGNHEYAFLRAMDKPEGIVWTTMALGPIVRTTMPKIATGEGDTILVTHQATRDAYITSVVKSGGEGPSLVSQRQTLDTTTKPLLRALTDRSERREAENPAPPR